MPGENRFESPDEALEKSMKLLDEAEFLLEEYPLHFIYSDRLPRRSPGYRFEMLAKLLESFYDEKHEEGALGRSERKFAYRSRLIAAGSLRRVGVALINEPFVEYGEDERITFTAAVNSIETVRFELDWEGACKLGKNSLPNEFMNEAAVTMIHHKVIPKVKELRRKAHRMMAGGLSEG